MKNLINFLVGCLFLAFTQVQAQDKDQTLSPYFLVKSKDKGTDQMPLKHTSANVNIAGVIADVTVKQVYVNEGENTLEAIYVFPGSTRAAVYAMTMTIGERKLIAKIEEKNKAREQYEQAKEQGKTASLLEQFNPNVFQMNVANILPGDSITVELRYTELLEPTDGVYSFAYPTVVGPRYSETLASNAKPNEKWVENPYLKEGKSPNYTFDIQTVLNAGMPIQDIVCSSHKVDIKYTGKTSSLVRLKPSEKFGGNRDYILKYRLAGGKVASGLLLYEGENAVASGEEEQFSDNEAEKFFLLMMQPPKVPKLDQIPPREYVFIVDVSGSMNGFPLGVSKTLLRELIGKLRPTDRFNVMLFESSNQMLSPESMTATQANIEKAIKVIDQQRGGGGTRLMPALENALAFKETKDFSRTFVVVTDGYVTVEREAFDLIRNNLNKANLFAFGIGSSVNRFLIEGMARAGMGEPFIVTNDQEAKTVGAKFLKYVQNPVLTNIKVAYNGFQAYDIEPLTVPDVFAERPIIIYGKYKGAARGSITVSGLSGGNQYRETIPVIKANRENNQALRYLWARKRIQMLDDYSQINSYGAENQARIKEITQLGLKYNLLTAYTSFIAVDNEVRNQNKEYETIKQPLPLPKGVSNKALSTRTNAKYRKKPAKYKKTQSVHDLNPVYNVAEPSLEEDEAEEIEELKEEELFLVVEQAASYPGGKNAWENYIKQKLKYPQKARQAGIEGTVTLEFIVDEHGKIKDIKVIKGLGYGCDEEAVRLLKNSIKWIAAKQQGRNVNSKIQLASNLRYKCWI